MLGLHFWRDRSGLRNFGDELSGALVEHYLGRGVRCAPLAEARLVAVGSLLATHFGPPGFWASFSGTIWGAGRMYDGPALELPLADVRAVRGRLTLERMVCQNSEQVVLGDPGLLVSDLVSGFVSDPAALPGGSGPSAAGRPAKYALGIVPHWSERGHPAYLKWIAGRDDVRLIDPTRGVRDVLHEMGQCALVAASSLHGLIAADSLGIPNIWLQRVSDADERPERVAFKFRDYFSVFPEATPEPVQLAALRTIDDVAGRARLCDREVLAGIQEGLRGGVFRGICEGMREWLKAKLARGAPGHRCAMPRPPQ